MSDEQLGPEDLYLLGRIATGNTWLRSLLCTLARRGTRMRQAEPERAAEILTQLSPWPWFKGGQFLFDLLEWEDFMVDGPPPPPLPQVLEPENWERLDDLLRKVRALLQVATEPPSSLDGPVPGAPSLADLKATWSDADLPPLEPGLHLYRDVVLGVWVSAAAGPAHPPS